MSNWKNNIKSQLEERELEVSGSAWDKLETQLNDEQKNNSSHNNRFYWMGIAASVCLLFILGFWLFNNEKNAKTPTTIVTNEVKMPKTPDVQPISTPELVVNKTTTKAEGKKSTKEVETHQPIENQNKKVLKVKPLDATQEKERLITVNQDSILEITPIAKIETDNKTSDEYLAEALKNNRLNKSEKLVVNKEGLLDQVEDEIYEEKSPSILQKLTEQAKKFQVAFSERNQAK